MIKSTMTSLCLVLLLSHSVSAAEVTLTPTDIHGDDTTTTSFSNPDLTLTPFVLDGAPGSEVPVQNTFNDNVNLLGIDNGTANAFNDPNTTAGDAGDELLVFDFSSNAGLSQIAHNFSRASGPLATDGVRISGFLGNPLTGDLAVDAPGSTSASFDPITGTATFQLNFSGGIRTFNFDPAFSAGQTLTLRVNDSDEANAQLAITGITYDNDTVAVPEPSSLAALCALGAGIAARRRKRNA